MKPSRLKVLKQYLVPQHALSWLAGWLSTRRWLWLKNWEITYFINRFDVNINEAQLTNIADYPTFNSFFTRLLKPDLRPVVTAPDAIASPADGLISQIGNIRNNLLIQAKGFDFTLQDLLGGSETLANKFINGEFTTIYLSPKDYHRVHMPVTGTLRETIFIPGKLFSVNQKTTLNVPQLFSRNERLVSLFDTENGSMAVILVGAMLVGSINTVWEGTTYHSQITSKIYSDNAAITLNRGAEMGHFKMGSTVIVLFAANKIAWQTDLAANSSIKMGEILGKSLHP